MIATLLLLAASLRAEEPLRLRIGLDVNSPPLSYLNKAGELEGFTVEFLREVERGGAVQFEFVPKYWRELQADFDAGRLDALANVVATEARRASMDFAISHVALHATTYTRPDRPSFTHAAELAGRRIGILTGSVVADRAQREHAWGGTIIAFPTLTSLLGAVKDGTCDVALLLRSLSFEQPDEMGLRRALVEDIAYRFRIALHRGERLPLERLNEALATVRQSDAWDVLHAKWIGPIEPRPLHFADLRPYMLPASLGALAVVAVIAMLRRTNQVLTRQAAALHLSEEKYRSVVQNAHEAIFVVQDRCLRFVNATMMRISGLTEAQLLGRSVLDFIESPNQEASLRNHARLLAGEIPQTRHEHLILLPDGRRLWLEVTGVRITWNGRPASLNFGADVTAARRAEQERTAAETRLRDSLQEKEALLKEVHHRVKNNLQVVSSLLRIEAGRHEHPATRNVLHEMTGRIRTMALLHETLYRTGNFGSVDLAAYLRQLSTQAFRSNDSMTGRIALEVNLAPAAIELDRAIPCGLIVNELLTNALKHGFPDGRSGAVRLALTWPDGDSQLLLSVSDDGVGLPADFESRQRNSLGLQLVNDLVRQLGGELRVSESSTFEVRLNRVRSGPTP